MPNTRVPAAGEAVSAINRRSLLSGMAAIPAVLASGAALASSDVPDIGSSIASAPAASSVHPDIESAVGWLKHNLQVAYGGEWWIHLDLKHGVVAVSQSV